ncbi:MAG: hypothetical protein IPP51_05345 [Bacteroidetes bacterium]|nr:hypothetical protein [Bacteroidota bacterium]
MIKYTTYLLACLFFVNVALGQSFQPDSSFNSTGKKNFTFYNNIDRAFGCLVQNDNKMVIVGLSKNNGTGFFELSFARFWEDGSLDVSFGTSGITYVDLGNQSSIGGQTPQLMMDAAGRIVAVNTGRGPAGLSQDIMACRLDTNGVLDPTFGTGGVKYIDMTNANTQPDEANAMCIDVYGNIYMIGATRTGSTPLDNDIAIAKLTEAGVLDNTFDGDGKKLFNPSGLADFGTGIAMQDDGKIVFGGTASGNINVFRMDSTGVLDTTFNGSGVRKLSISGGSDMTAIAIDSQGRIVVGGNSGTSVILARILPSGNLDSTFATAGIALINLAGQTCTSGFTIKIMPGDKVLFGGSMTTLNTGLDYFIGKVDEAGVIDFSFNGVGFVADGVAPTNVDDEAANFSLFSNGKIFISGTSVFSSAINEDVAMLMLKPDTLTAGITSASLEKSISLYPNPVVRSLRIVSKKATPAFIINEAGAIVCELNLLTGLNEVNVEKYSIGVYFLKAQGEVVRFVKE